MMKFKIIVTILVLHLTSFLYSQTDDNILGLGDKAHNFVLEDALGKKVSLDAIIKKGPVILTWYRGAWCPYCNLALAELQEHLSEFKELGAELIAISPQLPDNSLTLKEKKGLKFILLSDRDNAIAKKYGISFALSPEKNKQYEDKIGLSKYNGNNEGLLPIPATYIIDTDGIIRYAYVNKDYTKRADPHEILLALKKLKGNK